MNTRPLTKSNSDDLSRIPLRPVDFLQGNLKCSLSQEENFESRDLDYNPECIQSEKQAMEAFRFSEKIASKLWECWKTEYLATFSSADPHEIVITTLFSWPTFRRYRLRQSLKVSKKTHNHARSNTQTRYTKIPRKFLEIPHLSLTAHL